MKQRDRWNCLMDLFVTGGVVCYSPDLQMNNGCFWNPFESQYELWSWWHYEKHKLTGGWKSVDGLLLAVVTFSFNFGKTFQVGKLQSKSMVLRQCYMIYYFTFFVLKKEELDLKCEINVS